MMASRRVAAALVVTFALADRQTIQELDAALELDLEQANGAAGEAAGKVCSVTEKENKEQYGITFKYEPQGGCSAIKCHAYTFMAQTVKQMVRAEEKKVGRQSICECAEVSSGNFLFSYIIPPRDGQCTSQSCWVKYSDALFLYHRSKDSSLSTGDALDKPDHWQLSCESSDTAPAAKPLPDLSEIVDSMEKQEGEFAKAANKIRLQLMVKSAAGPAEVEQAKGNAVAVVPQTVVSEQIEEDLAALKDKFVKLSTSKKPSPKVKKQQDAIVLEAAQANLLAAPTIVDVVAGAKPGKQVLSKVFQIVKGGQTCAKHCAESECKEIVDEESCKAAQKMIGAKSFIHMMRKNTPSRNSNDIRGCSFRYSVSERKIMSVKFNPEGKKTTAIPPKSKAVGEGLLCGRYTEAPQPPSTAPSVEEDAAAPVQDKKPAPASVESASAKDAAAPVQDKKPAPASVESASAKVDEKPAEAVKPGSDVFNIFKDVEIPVIPKEVERPGVFVGRAAMKAQRPVYSKPPPIVINIEDLDFEDEEEETTDDSTNKEPPANIVSGQDKKETKQVPQKAVQASETDACVRQKTEQGKATCMCHRAQQETDKCRTEHKSVKQATNKWGCKMTGQKGKKKSCQPWIRVGFTAGHK